MAPVTPLTMSMHVTGYSCPRDAGLATRSTVEECCSPVLKVRESHGRLDEMEFAPGLQESGLSVFLPKITYHWKPESVMIVGGIPSAAQSAAFWRFYGDETTHMLQSRVSIHFERLQDPRHACLQSYHNPPSPDSSFLSPWGTCQACAWLQRHVIHVPTRAIFCVQAHLVTGHGHKLRLKGTNNCRPRLADGSIPMDAAVR